MTRINSTSEPVQGNSRRNKLIWIILVVLFLVICGYLLWTSSFFGRSLPEFTGESILTFTPLPLTTVHPATEIVPGFAPDKEQEITQTAPGEIVPVCGQTEPMIILALGIDEVEQADVIRVVRVDFVNRKILVLSIPRDFWVPIPGLEEHNITQFRINAAYGYGEYFNGRGQGVVKFSETMYQNYGITFDRYVVAHFSNFVDLVDQIGGIDIYLEEPIGAYASAGHHHFDGNSALLFVRQRTADLDAYRIQRQSAILKGLYQKLSQPEYLLKLPAMGISFIQDNTVVTDLRLQDVSTFTCFIREINRDSLVFVDIPYDLYTPMVTNYGRHIKVPKPEATIFIQEIIQHGLE